MTDSSEPQRPPQHFDYVWEWVEQWLVPYYRVKINPMAGKGLCWDPKWWHYPEVLARFFALHAAWEEAVEPTEPPSGQDTPPPPAGSAFFISHLRPHMRVIMDADTGPMSDAGPDNGFDGHPNLPMEPVPDDIRQLHTRYNMGNVAPMDPLFPDVFAWMEKWFVHVVRRKVIPGSGKGLAWDPAWWRYPLIVAQFQSLHAAWENARVGAPSAMSTWWVSHLDNQLPSIFDSDTGPMSAEIGGHTVGHPELVVAPMPLYIREKIAPDA